MGNINYKISLLISDFLSIFKNSIDKNEGEFDINNSNIKRRFEKGMEIIRLFIKTIMNEEELLNDELYYKYLIIIYRIFIFLKIKRKIIL